MEKIEKYMKQTLKNKVKITKAAIIAILITGGIAAPKIARANTPNEKAVDIFKDLTKADVDKHSLQELVNKPKFTDWTRFDHDNPREVFYLKLREICQKLVNMKTYDRSELLSMQSEINQLRHNVNSDGNYEIHRGVDQMNMLDREVSSFINNVTNQKLDKQIYANQMDRLAKIVDRNSEKSSTVNEHYYQYYITNENEKHGLELGDNSQARGTGSIVTSENGMAFGKGAVATGGDNTSREDIERKLRENQDKLNEIDNLKKTNATLTNQLSDLQQKEQDVIQAGIRVEQIRKAKADAEKEAEKLKNAWQTEVDGSKEFFKNYQDKIDDLNSRLTGVGKLKNNNIQSPEGLEKAVDEFKHNVEDGTNLNLSRDFYKDYITSYYKALGDLRENNALYNCIGNSGVLPNGKKNTIKNIIDANFLKRDLKDIVIQYNYSYSSSYGSSASHANNLSEMSSSSSSYSSHKGNSGQSYNSLGEYSVDTQGFETIVGIVQNGHQHYKGKSIKTYIDINADLTNQKDYDLWKSVKDGWKAQIHDANKRSGSEFFGKFDTLTNGKSTILFNMVTDMKFELVDLDYEITYDQWKYEQTHDVTWLDKKKECIDKRQQKLNTNEKILKDKYKELFGEELYYTSSLFGKIAKKIQDKWYKENITDVENKNEITTEKLTSELEQALGVNKNVIKERQEKLDRMKSEYEQAERNAKGLNPSEKDLILSKEYERVKAEIEQMTNTLKTNQERLKALKDALTLYDLKNKGKDNIAYGTDTLAVGNNAIAFGKGTKTVGENSISFGVDLLTTGNNNTNVGQLSQVNGEKNQVMGFSNEVKGDQNLVIGNNNRVISNGQVGVNPHSTSNTHGKTMGTLLSTPTLEVNNRTITQGETLNLNNLVFSAHDDKDGDLKDQVKVISVVNTQDGKKYEFDNNTFVGNVVGTYGVTYEVKNGYGATIHKVGDITVTKQPVAPEYPTSESITKTHTVTFIGIDGNKETVTVNDGDSLESTHLVGKYSSYNKPGYVFWNFSIDKIGKSKIDTKTPIHQDTTVYTIYKPIPTEPTLEPGATPNPSVTPDAEPEPQPQPHESKINMDKSRLYSEVDDDGNFKKSPSYMIAPKELQNLYDDVMEEAKAILNDPNGDISHLNKLKQLQDRLDSIKPNRSDDDVENNMFDNANNYIERKIDQLIKLSVDVINQANPSNADRSTTESSRVRTRRSVDANPNESESTPKTMTPIINENVLQGNRNEIFGNGNLVFGSENKVGTETKGVMNNILFGNKIDATNVNNAIVFGNESKPIEGAVSFGNDTTSRQLKFVAEGTDGTDAVNFSQLKDYVKKNAKGKTVNIKNELLSKLNYDPGTYLKIDKTYLQYIVDEKGNIKIPDTKKLSLNIDGVKDALGKDSDIANPKDKFVTDQKVHDYVTTNFVSKNDLDVTKLLKSSDVDVTGDEYITVTPNKNKYALSLNKDKLGTNIDLSNNSAITNINTELGKKANLDANNVKGTYLTNWQSTLGTGKIEDNDKGLVNGGVVKTYVDDQIKNNLGTINTSLSSKLSDISITGDKYINTKKVSNSNYELSLNEDALNTHLNSYDFKNNTTIQNINKNISDIDDMKANKDASNIDATTWITALGGLGHITPTNQKFVTGAVVHNFVTGTLDETVKKIDTKLDKKLDKDGLEVKGDTKYITVTSSDDNNKKIYTVKFNDSKLTETIKGSDFSDNTSIKSMLDKKANLDASNVTGDNLTKWQNKLGNGTIDANSTGLVTGQTIFNYVNPINEKVNTLETSLTDKLSDITINGDTYIKTEKASKGVYNLSLNKDTLESLINSKTANLAKNDAITNINKELDKKANKDASNLDDKDVENWQNKLGNGTVTDGDTKLVKGSTVFTYVNNSINTIKQELSNKATEDLAKKLDIDAKNLNGTGVTNLTKALGKGEIKDNDNKLVTGGTVKAYITEEINNINTKVSGKLSSEDVDVKGDAYITVNKDVQKPNHYSLVFNKEQLASDLDLTKNTKLNEQFNKYALLDGSNLESNEFNLNVWQAKLGNGAIASGNTGLVKGGDIFNYVNNIKQELNNQATLDLSNKLDKDGSNLDKTSLDKLTNKLSEESNLTTPTNRLVTDTKVSEALKGKLNADADNLSNTGITNLTNKLGTGVVKESDTGLITGGKVYEVKKELDNKYTTLNNQVTTNTNDISKLKTDVEDLKNTKQDITKINTKLGDIDNSITNINTKLDGKLDKTDLSIKGDKYIDVKKDNKFNYTLSFNKTTLENDLDLTNNSSINNIFNTKLGDINTNIGDLKTKVESNTNNINSLTTKVDTNTKDIDTLKQDMTKKLNVDADNLTTKGETNLINKLSKGSDISKPNNKLVTDTQVNNFLNDKFKNFSSIDNKVINTLQQGVNVANNKADLALAKSDLALNGISNAVAMANLPQVASYGKYKHMLTAAYGNYAGVNALALGLSGTTDSRRITYKISGAVNTKGNIAFGTGIGVMLGEIHDGNVDTPSHVKEQLIKSEKERQLMRQSLINQQNKAKQQEDQIKDLYRIIGELQNQLKKNK